MEILNMSYERINDNFLKLIMRLAVSSHNLRFSVLKLAQKVSGLILLKNSFS